MTTVLALGDDDLCDACNGLRKTREATRPGRLSS